MSKWEMVPIPEVVFFQEGPGVRSSQYTSTGVKLLNVANLQDGKVDLSTSNRYVSEEEAYGKYSHFLVDEGDFIIASSGIQVDYFDKKMGFINASHLPLCMNTSTIRFKSLDAKKLGIRYFMHYLKTQQFKNQLRRLITGSAQLNFGPSHLRRMRIPLPPLDIQHQITQALDQVDALVASREQQIVLLNELVKSRFVEMFETNCFETIAFGDMVHFLRNGANIKQRKGAGGYPITRIETLSNDRFNPDRMGFAGISDIAEYEKFILLPGDILISHINSIAYLGRAVQYRGECDSIVIHGMNLLCARLLQEFNPTYVEWFFKMPSARNYISTITKEAVNQASITSTDLKKMNIPNPPIELQNQFASFVVQVDKSKFVIQQSLAELETLKKALMQQYFG